MALWAQYTGEGLTAGTIPDQSGNGRDLNNSGVSQIVSSPFTPGGVAMGFNPNDSAEMPNLTFMPTEGTFCLWIQPQESSPAWFSDIPWSNFYMTGGTSGVNLTIGGTVLNGPNLTVNSEYAVVIEYSATAVNFFIDDMSTPYATAGGQTLTAKELFLGGFSGFGDPFTLDGILGNVCIYDHLLTEAERTSWKATGDTPQPEPEPEPLSWPAGEYFRVTLTGAPDSTTDVVLPPANINARLRSGSPSYLQVSLPYTDAVADQVNARPNGDLVLEHVALNSLGEEALTSVVDVALETITPSKGVENRTIVLVGHRQTTNAGPVSHTVVAKSWQGGATNNLIIPGFDPAIAAGDDVSGENVTYTVGTIVLRASIAAGRLSAQTQYVEG